MKEVQKEKAREMRKSGESMKVIARTLGVSRGSISVWTRDILLTEEQYEKLKLKVKSNWLSFASRQQSKKNELTSKKKREDYQEEGREKAKENNILHAMGCMLYWAEGGKKNNKNSIKMSNSDPFLMKLFIKFLRECFSVQNENITIRLNHYTDIVSLEEAQDYWLKELNLPKGCLRKSTLNNLSIYTKNKKCGSLKYGTCSLAVCSTELLQKIYGGIQEYGGFSRGAWLMGTDDRIV